MNELYVESMAAAVDRLYDEADVRHRRRRHQREEDLLRRRRTSTRWSRPAPADAAGGLRARRAGQGRRCAGSRPSPSRSSAAINGAALGGGFEIALACNHRIVVDGSFEVGLPEASLGLLPGGGGVTRIIRMLGIQSGLMDVLLQGSTFKPAAGQGEGARRRARRHPGRAGPGGQGLDQGQPGRRTEPVGRARLQDARRYAEVAGAGRLPPGVPRAAAQAAQGRRLPGAEGDPVRRGRGRPGRLRHRVAGSSRAT